jgi:hypothetical protein
MNFICPFNAKDYEMAKKMNGISVVFLIILIIFVCSASNSSMIPYQRLDELFTRFS